MILQILKQEVVTSSPLPPILEIEMPNLRVYGAVDAVHLGDEHLHVHEPLDGADDGGDDAHGFVGSYRDAANVP